MQFGVTGQKLVVDHWQSFYIVVSADSHNKASKKVWDQMQASGIKVRNLSTTLL